MFQLQTEDPQTGERSEMMEEEGKRNTGGVISPTTLSTLGKSHFVNLSLQRQRFRSAQENRFAHRLKIEIRKRIDADNNSSKH